MSRRALRMATTTAAAVLALTAGTAIGPVSQAACATAGGVAVVVRGPDGQEQGACLPAAGIDDGVDALRATGARVVTRDYGGDLGVAVCRINGAGTAPTDCPSALGHWHYWKLVAGRWVEQGAGPSNVRVDPGSTEGWTWSAGGAPTPPRVTDAASACRLPDLDLAGATTSGPGRSGLGAYASVAGAAGVLGVTGVIAARRRRS